MNLYLVDRARLRALREQASISQEELSEEIGRYNSGGVALIRELERQSRVHVLDIIGRRIAGTLGVEISELTAHPEPEGSTPQAPDALITSPISGRLGVDTIKLRLLRQRACLSREKREDRAGLKRGWLTEAENTSQAGELRARRGALRKLADALEISELVK